MFYCVSNKYKTTKFKMQNTYYCVLNLAHIGDRIAQQTEDSTQSGEEPRWKSLLCSKMDKVELENRVELESKKLENMVELEKQLTDLHSRVGAELSRVIMCAQVEDERSSLAELKICKVRYRVRCAPVEDEQCTAE